MTPGRDGSCGRLGPPIPKGTEVSAEAWWTAYREATADPALLAGVEALAVGGQQHGMVTLDSSGALVRDALLWNDNRSAPDADDLIAELGGPQAWADAVGTVPVASMTVSKIRWLGRAEPENARRTHAVALPHDWLTWRIGGESFDLTTDRGDASGTCYFDAARNEYRMDLVERAIGHELALPRVAAPDEIVGHSPAGIAIAPGTGDNMAAGSGLRPTTGRRGGLARHQRHRVHGVRPPDPRADRDRWPASPTPPAASCRSSAP